MTPSYGFYGAAQLLQMMDLLAEYQFTLRRTRVNAGFLKDQNQTDPAMVDAGWKLLQRNSTIVPCCVELHWNRDFAAQSKDKNVRGRDAISLLGIMTTAGELWVLSDWLRRHAALYTKLVVVDGANNAVHAVTRRLCAAYGNIVLLRQPKEMNATDQSLRWLAMSALGDPVGSWIHLAHPDEFYLIDPRQVAAHAEWADPHANVILWRPEWAVPTEEVWQWLTSREASYFDLRDSDGGRWMADGRQQTSSSSREFHIMDQVQHVDGNYRMCEERMFRWCQGCKYLPESHHVVTPAHFPNKRPFGPMGANYQSCIRQELNAPWYIHFKVHRFEPAFAAALNQSKIFSNSGFKTGLEWSGGVDGYYRQPRRRVGHALSITPIAVDVENFLRKRCNTVGRLVKYHLPQGRNNRTTIEQTIVADSAKAASPDSKEQAQVRRYPGCEVPWKVGATFKTA